MCKKDVKKKKPTPGVSPICFGKKPSGPFCPTAIKVTAAAIRWKQILDKIQTAVKSEKQFVPQGTAPPSPFVRTVRYGKSIQ